MTMSAIAQGKAGAVSADAFGETGKGFSLYITVALFVMAFTFGVL